MYFEQKEESKEENAIRLLTQIAIEFKNNYETTIGFDPEFVMDVITFLDYAENENKLIKALKDLDITNWGIK